VQFKRSTLFCHNRTDLTFVDHFVGKEKSQQARKETKIKGGMFWCDGLIWNEF